MRSNTTTRILLGVLMVCILVSLASSKTYVNANAITNILFGNDTASSKENFASSACNCVILRLDDIQDHYHDKAQLAIMNELISKNVPVSMGIIMHNFGNNDSDILDKVIEGYKKGLFELSLHGWDHVDYKNLSEAAQQESLSKANMKMTDIFRVPSRIFITPYNSFNNSTLEAMQKLGLRVISSDKYSDSGPYFVADGSSNRTDRYNIYHLPQTVELNAWQGDNMIKVPFSDIVNNATENISKYGYAIITFHPQYYSSVETDQNPEVLYKERINDLTNIINHFASSNIKIVSFSKIVGLKP